MAETTHEAAVDLAELVHHDRAIRAAAAEAIRRDLADRGAVLLLNHGVDFGLRDRIYARFLALTEGEPQQRLDAERSWFQRGWSREAGVSQSFLAAPMPSDPAGRIEHPELCAPNVWPDGDGSFERDFVQLGQQLHEAGLSVLTGVAVALGLVQRTFERRVDGAAHLMRLCRSSGSVDDDPAESSLLSIRPGRRFFEHGALEERSATDEGSGAEEPAEEPIVAVVGQQLEILTGGKLVARAPERDDIAGLRVVGTYELHLANHELVTPLARFRADEALRAYAPPVLAGTYRTKTLIDRGLAPTSALDRWGYRAGARPEIKGTGI